MKEKYTLKIFILVLIILIISFLTIRQVSPRYLDDLSPGIPCEDNLIKKADYIFVIPKYNNESISDNKEWCSDILDLNKNLAMHGVYHTYEEFSTPRDFDYIQEGTEIFFNCFSFYPTGFKAPQLVLSKENKKILETEFNFKIYAKFNQILHKTYHCNNSGSFSNNFQDLI